MKITKEIRKAIRQAAEQIGNPYQLSKKIGVSHSTVKFWLDGKTKNISGDIWYEKIQPMLNEKTGSYGSPPNEVASASGLRDVPVISFAQAAMIDVSIIPIDDFVKGCSDETALFANEIKDGYFALRAEGDSMSPKFPNGTVLLVAGGEYPERGDTVVAKIRESGQVVVKEYFRRNNVIRLESINPEGMNFEWNCKEQVGYVEWMYPVLEANINLRRQRWAEKSF